MKVTLITYKGKTQSITAWARESEITSGGLNSRLQRGWDFEKALLAPPLSHAQKWEYKGEMYTAKELAIMHGSVSTATMLSRLRTMTVEEALALPNQRPHRKERITEEQQKQMFKPKPKKPDNKLCRTCIYHGTLSGCGDLGAGNVYCDYIEIEGHRRPCPPPPNCTAYKQGKSLVRKVALSRMGKV